jgi:SAM-dependent methyltransferase
MWGQMSTNFGAGSHVASGRAVDVFAYDRFIGRWSRPFVPSVLDAAEVAPGCRVLDVSTGTGEVALMAIPIVGASGFVIGTDISPAMLEGARARLNGPVFWPVAADGRALPFRDPSYACVNLPAWLAVLCESGARAGGVPTRPSQRGQRDSVRRLDTGQGTYVGYTCRCIEPLPSGSAEHTLSIVLVI